MFSPAEHLETILGSVVDQIPPEVARPMIDGMAELRIAAGPRLAYKLAHTAPEDRTWRDGIAPAVLSATDKLDGWWARRIGTTDEGRELDREGDRGFVMPQQEALMRNGESRPIHYALKCAREGAMEELRGWGARHGKDISSRVTGQEKTVVEMTKATASHTPLSMNEDLMRWGDSMGTALSWTAFIEDLIDYAKSDKPKQTDTSRNSAARQVSAGPLGRIATLIHEKAPGVTPSHLTKWGKRLVETSAVLAVAKPDRPAFATTLYTVGSLFDTLDGSLARKKGEDSVEGMIEDVQADLEQQIASLAALSVIARKRGNKVAATNYAVAAMLTPLSALTRAQAESQGFIVPEGGMGTRLGRGILAGVGMGLNRYGDASDIVSAMLLAGTVNTVKERRDVVEHGHDSKHCIGTNDDEEFKAEARLREQAILPYAAAGIAVGTVLLVEGNFRSIRGLFAKAPIQQPEAPVAAQAEPTEAPATLDFAV